MGTQEELAPRHIPGTQVITDLRDHQPGNLVLQGEHIGELAIERFGQDVQACRGINELGGNA